MQKLRLNFGEKNPRLFTFLFLFRDVGDTISCVLRYAEICSRHFVENNPRLVTFLLFFRDVGDMSNNFADYYFTTF